jgi:hypothetical protein
MRYLKTYKIFEAHDDIDNILRDIIIEINDDEFWKAEFLFDSNNQKYIIIIKTKDSWEYEFEGQPMIPSSIIVESIENVIRFMKSEEFVNYKISFDENDSGSKTIETKNVNDIFDMDFWPYSSLKIEFWK